MHRRNLEANDALTSLRRVLIALKSIVAALERTAGVREGRLHWVTWLRGTIAAGIVLCCVTGAYLLPSTGAYPEPKFRTSIDLWIKEGPLPENSYVNVAISPTERGVAASIEAPFAAKIEISYNGVGPFPDTPEGDISVDQSRAQLLPPEEEEAWGWTVVAKDGRDDMSRERPAGERVPPIFEEDVCHNWADPQVWVALSPLAVGSMSDGRLTQSVPSVRVIGATGGRVRMRVLLCPFDDYVIDATDMPPSRVATGWWLWEQAQTGSEEDFPTLDVGTVRAHSLSRVDGDSRKSVLSGALFGFAGGLVLLLPATPGRRSLGHPVARQSRPTIIWPDRTRRRSIRPGNRHLLGSRAGTAARRRRSKGRRAARSSSAPRS